MLMLPLSKKQKALLAKIANGETLKSHRHLDGRKVYLLHPLNGKPAAVSPRAVQSLVRHGMLSSNQKFPVATFYLTPKGAAITEKFRRDSQ